MFVFYLPTSLGFSVLFNSLSHTITTTYSTVSYFSSEFLMHPVSQQHQNKAGTGWVINIPLNMGSLGVGTPAFPDDNSW
jgi:hypothetical protein